LFAATLAAAPLSVQAAPKPPANVQVVSDDVGRFWIAYDAVRAAQDPAERLRLIQTLYIDRGTPGLAAFMEAKGYTAQSYVDAITKYPRYWETIRPRTALTKTALANVGPYLNKFLTLYPGLKPAGIYFEVGALRSGGTTLGDKVLIGVEMASGDESVDTSEMSAGLKKFFGAYFASKPLDNLDLTVVHEFVHTQEHGERKTLLAQAVYEGVADFVAERVTGRLPDLAYVGYGPANDAAIKAAFQRDMMANDYSGWLYNSASGNPFGVRDLGYYVGYAICTGYYAHQADKKAALTKMIELDFSDQDAVGRFVAASGYFGLPT
jgi:hypothetical protein